MKTQVRLKRTSGWFAAGPEVESALRLLSDAGFKLFVWLCLHADRSRGCLVAGTAELARTLQKAEGEIRSSLQELSDKGICLLGDHSSIEIAPRFWPYQRSASTLSASPGLAAYIQSVRQRFLERDCVRSTFTPADEKLAGQLYEEGISLAQAERAILLGCARKYIALLNNGRGTPITSLHYFRALFNEVRQEVSPSYWGYVALKVRTFEEQFRRSPELLGAAGETN
jgi:hypothetical protein